MGAGRRDEALERAVVHSPEWGSGYQPRPRPWQPGWCPDEDIDLAVGQALFLVCTAVIRNHGYLAALHGDQGTPGQMAVGQGVAAGHLDAAVLGLFQNGSQRLVGRGVHDPGTVINGADGIHGITVEIHFLGAELFAQIMAVADAIAKDQQLFCHGGTVISKVGGCGETVAARSCSPR